MIGLISPNAITTNMFCGRLAILQVAAEMRRFRSSVNTLSSSKRQVSPKTAPCIPALKDGDTRRTGLNLVKRGVRINSDILL